MTRLPTYEENLELWQKAKERNHQSIRDFHASLDKNETLIEAGEDFGELEFFAFNRSGKAYLIKGKDGELLGKPVSSCKKGDMLRIRAVVK